MKKALPKKNDTNDYDAEKEYCKNLVSTVEKLKLDSMPIVKDQVDYLKEMIEDDIIAQELLKDKEAKVGFKTQQDHFYGYKSHLAINSERFITAMYCTPGNKADVNYLAHLIMESVNNGMTLYADRVNALKKNLEFCEELDVVLLARLNPTLVGTKNLEEDGFTYNKDSDGLFCPKGGHSIQTKYKRKGKNVLDGNGDVVSYFFDVEKCKECPMKDGCYKEGSKTKSRSRTIIADTYAKQRKFELAEDFKQRYKERYKIEVKNSEAKNQHGLERAIYDDILGINIQVATSAFVMNMKRILSLTK